MTRGCDIADAAYLASRAATHEDCIKMILYMFGTVGRLGRVKGHMFRGSGCSMQLSG